jgi:hypothetical protein
MPTTSLHARSVLCWAIGVLTGGVMVLSVPAAAHRHG